MRHILSAILLALFFHPAWAKTVYYCIADEGQENTTDGVTEVRFKPFKMAVDNQLMQLSGGAFETSYDVELELSVKNKIYHGTDTAVLVDGSKVTVAIVTFRPADLAFSTACRKPINSIQSSSTSVTPSSITASSCSMVRHKGMS